MLSEEQLGYFGLVGMKWIVHDQRVFALHGDGVPIDDVAAGLVAQVTDCDTAGLSARIGRWILGTERDAFGRDHPLRPPLVDQRKIQPSTWVDVVVFEIE